MSGREEYIRERAPKSSSASSRLFKIKSSVPSAVADSILPSPHLSNSRWEIGTGYSLPYLASHFMNSSAWLRLGMSNTFPMRNLGFGPGGRRDRSPSFS